MAKLAIVHERTGGGEWRPVGVVLGTTQRIDFRFLPGQSGWMRWAQGVAENAQPPYLDGNGENPERGTWEDWIPWSVRAFSNGHDAWFTQIDEPEPTLDANYQKYVLGSKTPTPPAPLPDANEIPDLAGFVKARPS